MSDSEAETREVEMVDAVEEQEQQEERTKMNGGDAHSEDDTSVASAKSKPDDDHVDGADHVMTSGHITPDDPERKTDDEEQDIASTSVSDEPKPSIAAPLNVPLLNGHSEHPIPSVETDEPAADEQQPEPSNAHMKSPAVETRPSHKASGSPNRQRSNVPNNNRHSEMDSIKRDKEIARVMEVIKEVSPEALQQVLRKNWRLFLFEGYAEDHVAFILRAGLKNSNINVLERILKDDSIFKDPFQIVASLKPNIIQRVLRNATPAQLKEHLRDSAVDKLIAERIKNVPARDIITMLANANRLGFSEDDILDDEDESVIPNIPSRSQSQRDVDMADEVFEVEAPTPSAPAALPKMLVLPSANLAMPNRDPLLAEQSAEKERNAAAARSAQHQHAIARQQQIIRDHQVMAPATPGAPPGPMVCNHCHYRFANVSGFNYHNNKNVCQKQKVPVDGWKWWCENCRQNFTTKQGKEYHVMKGVCLGDDIAPATSPSMQLQQEAASRSGPPPRSPSDPILPPTRPPFSANAAAIVQDNPAQSQPSFRPEVQLPPRPPLHTPAVSAPPVSTPNAAAIRKPEPPPDVRTAPSDLPPAKRQEMERRIEEVDRKFAEDSANIPADWPEEQRAARLQSLKNGNASKKSQIRKSYGVTLRMREKDKAYAKQVAALSSPASSQQATPSARPRMEDYKSSPLNATSTPGPAHSRPAFSPTNILLPITTGFSPVNAPPPTAPSPANGYGTPHAPSPLSSYENRPPPSNTMAKARPDQPPSGFGVLRSHPAPPRNHSSPYGPPPPPPQPGYNNSPYGAAPHSNNKRRRESEDDHAPRPSPSARASPIAFSGNVQNPAGQSGVAMQEVSVVDAGAKFGTIKKVPVGAAQSRWEALQPRKGSGSAPSSRPGSSGNNVQDRAGHRDGVMSVSAMVTKGEGSKDSAITIDSSDETGEEDAAMRRGSSAAKALANAAITSAPVVVEERSGDSTEEAETMEVEEKPEGRTRSATAGNGGSQSPNMRRTFMARRGGRH